MSYLMLDLLSVEVNGAEVEMLRHPQVGGLILFSRNFTSREQLVNLVKQIRSIRPEILIAVDHEGGRVQRFRDGFTHIPAMGDILPAAKGDISLAKRWARELGFLMAIELLACDIDLSFAPVLDLNGVSQVIGKRSFSAKPDEVIALADSFIDGMAEAGMGAVGKHFPGHGSVEADSHIAQPIDEREGEAIFNEDILPFKALIANGKLTGIMPAHVIYPKLDANPAGFSTYWLQRILRQELGFKGVIFSDDLGMKGATFAGDYLGRAKAALDAGCDMILVCNDNPGVMTLLNGFEWPTSEPKYPASLLKPNEGQTALALENSARWENAKQLAEQINLAQHAKI
ncbi:beta-N-acetylhexosaminidase [Shewanella sp. A25]|nr:beta-N-acetylhexosaminidase [Shewanella shenzhenensis]